MEKSLFLGILILFPFLVFSQKVTFRYGQFDNGYQYPLVVFNSDKAIELSINEDIEKEVEQYRDRDFCIGQSGLIQKTSFIQIHIYANCIDMDESDNNYYLYDLETGIRCKVSDMLNKRVEDEFNTFLLRRIKKHIEAKSIVVTDIEKEALELLRIDDFNPVFESNGIQFTSKTMESWGEEKMFISWTDIQTYLKISYI